MGPRPAPASSAVETDTTQVAWLAPSGDRRPGGRGRAAWEAGAARPDWPHSRPSRTAEPPRSPIRRIAPPLWILPTHRLTGGPNPTSGPARRAVARSSWSRSPGAVAGRRGPGPRRPGRSQPSGNPWGRGGPPTAGERGGAHVRRDDRGAAGEGRTFRPEGFGGGPHRRPRAYDRADDDPEGFWAEQPESARLARTVGHVLEGTRLRKGSAAERTSRQLPRRHVEAGHGTRSPSTGRARAATPAASPTASCSTRRPASPTSSRASASPRATGWRSTWGWSPRSRWRCWPAPV